MLDVIFVGNFPQPPLNHCREKEWPPLKIIIAHPLGKLWMLPNNTSNNSAKGTSYKGYAKQWKLKDRPLITL